MHVLNFVTLFALGWLPIEGQTQAGSTSPSPSSNVFGRWVFPFVEYTDTPGNLVYYNFVYDCFPTVSLGFPQEVRIGMSASVMSDFPRSELEGMLNTLIFWHVQSKSEYWNAGIVKFCVIDDKGDPQISRDAYMAFAGHMPSRVAIASMLQPHEDPQRAPVTDHTTIAAMDYLLGPLDHNFVYDAVKIAHDHRKLIVLWSSPRSYYSLPHLPESLPYLSPDRMAMDEWSRRLDDTLATTVKSGPSPHRILQRGPPPRAEDMTQINMAQGSLSSPYVLDMNPRIEEYGFPIIDSLYAHFGPEHDEHYLHIMDFMDDTCPGQLLQDYAKSLGFTAVLEQVDSTGLRDNISVNPRWMPLVGHFNSFRSDITRITRKLDALLLCTSDVHYFLLTLAFLDSQNIFPGALVSIYPGMYDALNAMYEHYPLQYFLEPRPFPFLSRDLRIQHWAQDPKALHMSYYEFQENYKKAFDMKPTMMTLQMLAVSSVISTALWSRQYRPNSGEDDRASFIKSIAQTYTVETFDGPKRFDENGACSTCFAGVHQVFAVPEDVSNDTYTRARFNTTIIKIIPGVGYTASSIPEDFSSQVSGSLVYPMPGWRQKLLEVYVCPPGCVMRGTSCSACPRGKYRSDSDLHCRYCSRGKYSDVEAHAKCWDCPEGAICNSTSRTPIAAPGWFRITSSTPSRDATEQCVFGLQAFDEHVFVKCPGANSCLGDNRCASDNLGMVCSNCISGSTFMGLSPARRKCGLCPGDGLMLLHLVLIACVFGALLAFLSGLTYRTAKDGASLVIPVVCIALRHIQMMGIIQSTMVIDRWEDSYFAGLPGMLGSVLIQPFIVAQMDCAVHTSGYQEYFEKMDPSLGQQEDQFRPHQVLHLCGVLMFPVGLFCIVTYHLGRRVCAFCNVMCKYGTSKTNPTYGKKDVMCLRAKRSETTLQAHVSMYAMPRQIIGWSLLTLPVSVHASALVSACHTIRGSEILVLVSNPDVRCTEEPYTGHFALTVVISALSTIPIVGGLLYAVFHASKTLGTLNVRYTIGFLTIGWRSNFCYFEVLLFCRTIAMAMAPMFCNGQENLFFFQFFILFLSAVLQSSLKPRVESDRHILFTLEDFSMSALLTTLILGWLMNVGMVNKPLIHESMLPGFFNDNKITFLDIAALMNLFLLLRCCTAVWWNQVIIPMQILYTVYDVVSTWGFCVLYFSNLTCGLNAVKLVIEKTGENEILESNRGYLDISELNEREHRFLWRFSKQVLTVCIDSRNRFNVGFIIGVFQETFKRAGECREAELNKNSGTTMNRMLRTRQLQEKVASTPRLPLKSGHGAEISEGISGSPQRTQSLSSLKRVKSISSVKFDMATHGVTLDELYYSFLDVEYDVMNHEPAMHQVLQAASGKESFKEHKKHHHHNKQETELEKDPSQIFQKQSTMPIAAAEVKISDEFLSEVNAAVLRTARSHESHTQYADMKTALERNAETQSELSKLKQEIHKARVARLRVAHASSDEIDSGANTLFGAHQPALKSDIQTLHTHWLGELNRANDDHMANVRKEVDGTAILEEAADLANITSVMSPRARGIEKKELPVSFWERVDASNEKKLGKSAIGSSLFGIGMQPHDRTESIASTSAGVSPVPIAAGPKEYLDLHFDTPFGKVHQMIFKAMLLSSLRSACGVPEDIIAELKVTLREGENTILGSGIIARVCIPSVFMTEVGGKDLSQLMVMEYPVRRVMRVDPMQEGPKTPKTPIEVSPAHPISLVGQSAQAKAKASRASSEVLELIKSARFPAAKKILDEEGGSALSLTDSQIERIARIEKEFQKSLQAFQISTDWQSDSIDDFNFNYGCKVGDDVFRSFLSADFEHGDPILAVQALSDFASSGSFNKDMVSARLLVEHSPADTLWHVLRSVKELGSKEDNIVQLSIIDALDESNAFLICFSTPSDGTLVSLRGVSLPPPQAGMTRVADSFVVARIKPLRKSGTANLWGFNLTIVSCARPSRMAYNFLWMMPPWGVLRVYRQMVQDFPAAFQNSLSVLSGQRPLDGERSPAWTGLFNKMQERLAGMVHRAVEKVDPRTDSESPTVPDLFPVVGAPTLQFL